MANKPTSHIPEVVLPSRKVDVSEIISFQNRCLDPFASMVLQEALDYALETTERRLDNMQRVFPSAKFVNSVEETLSLMEGILAGLKAAPKCSNEQKKPLAPGFEPRGAKSPPKVESVSSPTEQGSVSLPEPIVSVPEEHKRTVPERWLVPVKWEEKTYESPTELARVLKFKTLQARNIIEAFNDAGYKVYDGETERTPKAPGSKTVGEFKVVRVSPTPEKLIAKEVVPIVPLPPKPKRGEPAGPLTVTKDASGRLLRIQNQNGTEYIPPANQEIITAAIKRLPAEYQLPGSPKNMEVLNLWIRRVRELEEGPKVEPLTGGSRKKYEVRMQDEEGKVSEFILVDVWNKSLPMNYVSVDSPVGKALNRKRPGDKIELFDHEYIVKEAINYEGA
jgi:hypothetical protein